MSCTQNTPSYGLVGLFMHTRPICRIWSSCSLVATFCNVQWLSIWKAAVQCFRRKHRSAAYWWLSQHACLQDKGLDKVHGQPPTHSHTQSLSEQLRTIMPFFQSPRAAGVNGRKPGTRFGDRRKPGQIIFHTCNIQIQRLYVHKPVSYSTISLFQYI